MYTCMNFKTKKELKEALARGEDVHVFQPGGLSPKVEDGMTCLEGPHFPKPHTWYAEATIRDGLVVRVK